MKKEFNNIIDFLSSFKDEDACQAYFEHIRFRDGEYCPHCGYTKIYRFRDSRFRCAGCRKDFTIKTGTVFGESKVSLQKWFVAIYLLSTNKKGISSVQLAKQVGVTQKTAWFIDHRIRRAMNQNKGQLFGKVEMDETYVGGKDRNKHYAKRFMGTQGRNMDTKSPVFGMLQRNGEIRAKVVPDVKMRTLEKHIVENIKIGSELYTDTFTSYGQIGKLYSHEAVNHSRRQYVKKDNVHTNSVESFWTTFKRGYYGTYHYMSREHLQRYVDEFTYRFNKRKANLSDIFSDLVLKVSIGSTLPYKLLTSK